MFDKKKIGIGIDDFKTVIEKNYYFVDKSKLIEDIIADGAIVKLFCRPRRFGKTLNMSMMKYFFDIREKEENRKLFEGLYIENSPMIEEQGKYPVIFLTLKEIKGNNIESMYTQIKTLISDLFNQYEYLRENLNERDIEIFDNLRKRKDEDYSNSLKFLIECLNNYYKQKVVLLIDEYDTPLLICTLSSTQFNYQHFFL